MTEREMIENLYWVFSPRTGIALAAVSKDDAAKFNDEHKESIEVAAEKLYQSLKAATKGFVDTNIILTQFGTGIDAYLNYGKKILSL